jgi:RNA polymerase primary sigma factor
LARMTMQDSGGLDLYLKGLNSAEVLDPEEEAALARRMRKGSRSARDSLVKANLRFVVNIAKEYQHRGVPLADLISAGNAGLMTAAERFDVTLGYRFISYAVWWIRLAMRHTLAQERHLLRLPANRIDLLASISLTRDKLRQECGEEPDAGTVACTLGVSEGMVRDTLMLAKDTWSLDLKFDDGAETSLMERLPDEMADPPDLSVSRSSSRNRIEAVLTTLSKKQQVVVRMYYGLDDGEGMTLQQIGEKLNLCRERVRQIKAQALQRLQHPKRRGVLEELVDQL